MHMATTVKERLLITKIKVKLLINQVFLMKKNCSSNSSYNIEERELILYSLIIHKCSNLKKSLKEIYQQRNYLILKSIKILH